MPTMQSPYTRAEFIANEIAMGIEAQGTPTVDFFDLDPSAMKSIKDRAEWNAQAAERAGVVWRTIPNSPTAFHIHTDSGTRRSSWAVHPTTSLHASPPLTAERSCNVTSNSSGKGQDLRLDQRGDARPQPPTGLSDELGSDSRHADDDLADRIQKLERAVGSPDDPEQPDLHFRISALDRAQNRIEAKEETIQSVLRRVHELEQRVTKLDVMWRELTEATGTAGFDPDDDESLDERLTALEFHLSGVSREILDMHVNRLKPLEDRANRASATVSRIESEWQIEGQKLASDRERLRQWVTETVERATQDINTVGVNLRETGSRVGELYGRIVELEGVVRRLDADVALLRDAACPPQGAPAETTTKLTGTDDNNDWQYTTDATAWQVAEGEVPRFDGSRPFRLEDRIAWYTGSEVWKAMGITRQVEVPVYERIKGVPVESLWSALKGTPQDLMLDYLWSNHLCMMGRSAKRNGLIVKVQDETPADEPLLVIKTSGDRWYTGMSFNEIATAIAAGLAPGSKEPGGWIAVPNGYMEWASMRAKDPALD